MVPDRVGPAGVLGAAAPARRQGAAGCECTPSSGWRGDIRGEAARPYPLSLSDYPLCSFLCLAVPCLESCSLMTAGADGAVASGAEGQAEME